MKDFITKANKTGGNDSGSATGQGAFEQNSVNDELKLVVTSTGQTPTAGTGADPNTTQLATALTIISQTANSYQDSGVASAYVLSQSGSLAQASEYFEGEIITFETANSNTGATTVNKATLGVKKILTVGGSAMVGGEILAGRINFIKYDSTADGGSGAYIFITNSDLWAQNNIFQVDDRKANGTDGGGSLALTWNPRDLNNPIENTIVGASLSANQITLPSGKYSIDASAPALKVDTHEVRLQNITDASTSCFGQNAVSSSTDDTLTRAFMNDSFSITSTKVFELQHYTLVAVAGNGLGNAIANGTDEIYSTLKIVRIGDA